MLAENSVTGSRTLSIFFCAKRRESRRKGYRRRQEIADNVFWIISGPKKSPARRVLPCERGCVRVKNEYLEDQLKAQLHGSSIVRAGDLAYVRAPDGTVDTAAIYVSTELRVIPNVVGFKTKFGMEPFGEGDVLE